MGNPVATGCECKHWKCISSATHVCFQARPSLRVATKHKQSGNFKMKPIEGGKQWDKMLRYICLT